MTISAHYDNLELRVALPNEQVLAELHGRRRVTVTILPGHAERVGEQELSGQLARLARLLFAHRAAAFQRLNKEYLGTETMQRPPRPQDEEFRRAYEALAVSGSSRDGSVTCTTLGMEHWTVDIEPGSVARLGSSGLAQATTEAANELVENALAAVRQTRHDVYAKHD